MKLQAYIVALHAALLAILLAVSPAGSGSIPLLGAGGSVASPFQGAGDTVSGASVWYSCARVYTAAQASTSTSLCDLVDSTAPTVTICTLRGSASGFVDLTGTYCTGGVTPAAKCAAATGGVCNIKQAYDQTGGGIHITQTTAANQPVLQFSALNGLPGISCSSSVTTSLSNASYALSEPLTMVSVSKRSGSFTTQGIIIGRVDGATQMSYSSSTSTVFIFAGTSLGNATATDSAFHSLQGYANNNASHMYVDSTDTPVSLNNSVAFSGASEVCGNVTGLVMEVGVWGLDFSASSRATNMNTNLHGTSGYNF